MQENSKNEFLKIAKEYVLNNAGDHVEVSYTEDHDDLFVFGYQAKDKKVKLVGQGPIVLVKKDGRIIEYGSATGIKQALIEVINKLNKERLIRIYYKDYDIWNGKYNLIINEVDDYWEEIMGIGELILEELVNILLKHKIYNSSLYDSNNPESYYYTKEQLEKALKQPPLILERHFCEKLEDLLVDLIDTNMYFDWTLSETK
ncbi:hypothetical protein CQ046_22020 [Chryseobacterium sp. MYb7]|uniref:hypothetical protein n=1 Tax=Chryseobacterium sp. MYb7 TaxID=1827290 RepID=UPI000CFFCA08|nr:hypothetical protein [Chryseobacterium sp. MYb7]PRA95389.1 hypothetical protein CQ046_22020 [Chryseobacterium sp. MYb7]